ncbi:MAG: hypothetical protein V7693_16070 [Halopseudomonas sabulinigri]
MTIQMVYPSTAIDMLGPYLAAKVTCPACQHENLLVRTEGPVSPVKAVDVCSHIRAHIIDDDGESVFEFEYTTQGQ